MRVSKKALVVHSGGMDSSLCLALAVREFGPAQVLSLSFDYHQRHSNEIERAQRIATHFQVDHTVIDLSCLAQITENALTNRTVPIAHTQGQAPTTLVVGRNGLMARIAGIHAQSLGASCIYLGVMELEGENSGYRDCSRAYMDLIQSALRLDFADARFEIRTPLVQMTKAQTMELGHELGVLEYLLEETVTCYNGLPKIGCKSCPACLLRNAGLRMFLRTHQDFKFSWKNEL